MRRVALLLVVALAGCAAGQDPTITAGGTTGAGGTGTTEPAPAPTTAATAAPASTPPVSAAATTERAYLTGVRVLSSPETGGTRVAFEFDPVVPGYRVDYVARPVVEDGSGDEVAVRGGALLEVRMENAAAARLDGERVVRTYTGPDRVRPGEAGGLLVEAVAIGDFEGAVTWVLGLTRRVPAVSVRTAAGPPQLVIDLPAGG